MFRRLLAVALCLGSPLGEAAGPYWLDVRSPEEFAADHLPGSINVPYLEIGTRIREITRDPEADIRVYCAVGGRAQVAAVWLQSLGYQNVRNEGGLEAARAQQAATRSGGTCSKRKAATDISEKEEAC